jgi:hypothetical protein
MLTSGVSTTTIDCRSPGASAPVNQPLADAPVPLWIHIRTLWCGFRRHAGWTDRPVRDARPTGAVMADLESASANQPTDSANGAVRPV